jgi:hypothetical protein
MSWFPLQFDRLHEAPKRNKADFGGRQQIIFQATGELAGPSRRAKSAQATIAPETIEPAATAALFPAKFLGTFGNSDSEARSKIELDGVARHADRIG